MKYIKLFEGFDSTAISSVLSFISKKIGKGEYEKFLQHLKSLEKFFDIPLGSIDDSQIKYLPAFKALTVEADDEVMNPSGIFCLKYWFSLEKGFIIETGVGEKTMDFSQISRTMFPKATGGTLTQEMLDDVNYIINEDDDYEVYDRTNPYVDINGGILISVNRIDEVKTGDVLVCLFDPDEEEDESYVREYFRDFLMVGKVYKTPDNSVYLFNSKFDYDDYPEEPDPGTPEWDIYQGLADQFSSCINIGNNGQMYYYNIFKLIPDDGPLRFNEQPKEEEDYSVWNYNLPVRNERQRKFLVNWDRGYKKQLEDVLSADFAIIIYLDYILADDGKSDISKMRKSNRQDASALINNETHKKINLNKYIDKMFNQHGFDKSESGEFKNLNNIVVGLSKSILIDEDIITHLSQFSNAVQNLMTSGSKSSALEYLKNDFFSLKRKQYDVDNMNRNIKYVKDNATKELLTIFNKLFNIGALVQNYIKKHEIKTIYDLTAITYKLSSIRQLANSNVYRLSDTVRNIQLRLDRDYDLKSPLEYSNEVYDKDVYKKDLEKIKNLEKFVKSILK